MNEIYLSPGTPSAPAPVEYENMTDVEKMEWLISDANDSARPHMTDAAHILAAQLVAAEELRDELVAALTALLAQRNNIEVLGEWSALDMNHTSGRKVRATIDSVVAQGRAALAKARTGGG